MRLLAIAFLTVILGGAGVPAFAQEAPPGLVGRVSYVSGDLAFHMPDATEWSAALVNYPVASGGDFWVYPQSRAEFRIGPQAIEIDGGSELDVEQLTETALQLGLPQGRMYLRLRSPLPGDGAVRIDLPRGTVLLLRPGAYDIAAGSDSEPSRIAVFEGAARFTGGTIDLEIRAGDALAVAGTDQSSVRTEHAAADAFDDWARSRTKGEPQVAALRYVSPDMTGYADLDEYGSWQQAGGYGAVWYPRAVPADWAPYRDGHWVWVEPWGWTWVDAEPWGFAPFHYGRWAHIAGRWAWVPGRRERHPVYAPALVAFVGEPTGLQVHGAAGPAVGWFPLGPREVYWPTYTRNRTYIRNLNITNVSETKITRITQVVINQPAAGPPQQVVRQNFVNRNAATVVPAKVFATAARIDPKATLHVAPQTLRQAPVSVRPPQVTRTAARIAPAKPVPVPVRPKAAHPVNAPAGTVAAPAAGAVAHPPAAGAPAHAPAAAAAIPPKTAPAAGGPHHLAPPTGPVTPHPAEPASAPAATKHPEPPHGPAAAPPKTAPVAGGPHHLAPPTGPVAPHSAPHTAAPTAASVHAPPVHHAPAAEHRPPAVHTPSHEPAAVHVPREERHPPPPAQSHSAAHPTAARPAPHPHEAPHPEAHPAAVHPAPHAAPEHHAAPRPPEVVRPAPHPTPHPAPEHHAPPRAPEVVRPAPHPAPEHHAAPHPEPAPQPPTAVHPAHAGPPPGPPGPRGGGHEEKHGKDHP